MLRPFRFLNEFAGKVGGLLQTPFLLAIRLYWGYQFFITGKGKLSDVPTFTENFAQWGVPSPKMSVILAGSTECFCGVLLLVGLFSRLACIPLIGTMTVAYLTAHIDVVKGIWENSDAFVSAPPFLFLLASLIVLIFGPGAISLDRWIQKRA